MFPKKEDTILVDPSLLEDEKSPEPVAQDEKQLADRMDRSLILNYSLALMGLVYLFMYFRENGFNLNINILIFMFIALGIIAHGSLIDYSKAFGKGATTAAGIILRIPFMPASWAL
jgi:short-chain fatty acids transporter